MTLIPQGAQDLQAMTRDELCTLVGALVDNQQHMAVSMQRMTEEMQLLRRSVQQLTKVTPSQATELNRLMRETAQALSDRYRVQAVDKVAALIRKDVRLRAGIKSMRDLPRCEYEAFCSYIALWDDYKKIRALREKLRGESR